MSNFGDLSAEKIGLKMEDPSFNGNNITNHVLYQEGPSANNKKKQIFYIPSYVWIQVLNFTNLSHQNLEGQINMVINVAINTHGIDETIRKKIKSKIILMFNRIDAINLGDEEELQVTQTEINDNQQITQYTVKKLIKAGMIGDITLTPFEMIYLIVSIRIQQIKISLSVLLEEYEKEILQEKDNENEAKDKEWEKINSQKKIIMLQNKEKTELEKERDEVKKMMEDYDIVEIYFNLMDINQEKNQFSKITFNDQGTFGTYDLAQKYLHAEYTNNDVAQRIRNKNKLLKKAHQKKRIKIDESEINPFSFAHFEIPLYKFPCIGLFTIFVPLWLLGIIGLGVFFQDTGLADRIGSLAALMIAFIALIPVIRTQLPQNPDITLVQVLVYLQTLTIIFCLIESLIVRDSEVYEFKWQQNGWFLASLVIMLLQFFIIFVLSVYFWIMKLYYYNKHRDEVYKANFTSDSYKAWENQDCDKHFRRKIDSREIEVYELRKNLANRPEKGNVPPAANNAPPLINGSQNQMERQNSDEHFGNESSSIVMLDVK